MALAKRIIPRLDIKGPNLVKGVCLEGLRVLGKPEDFAKYYYEQGADELIYQDVVASLYGRNSIYEIITRTSREIFIPLTVGGGIRTVEDIAKTLRAGADKVAINTAAINNPKLISDAAKKFGSSTIVVTIEAIQQPDGRYLAFTDNGRNRTETDAVEWAKEVEKRGAGEILLTSVDREGTGSGFDLDLIRKVTSLISIPVIAHGGAGNLEHIYETFQDGQASAVAIASILHYDFVKTNKDLREYKEGNIEYLKKSDQPLRIETASLKTIKNYLIERGVNCRT
jgi:imidazole glycerol-phosphate synthase subunit HisF